MVTMFRNNLSNFKTLLFLLLFLQLMDKGLLQMFELNEHTFDQYTKDKDIMLIEFIMPWCKHCQRLQPEWDKAAAILASNKEYVLGKVNCWEDGKSMCDKLKIPMFPEIRLYRHGVFTEKFEGDRTAGTILDFIQKAQTTTGLVGNAPPLPQTPQVLPPGAAMQPAELPPPAPLTPLLEPPPPPPPPVALPPPPLPPLSTPEITTTTAAPPVEAKQDFLQYQSLVPPPPMVQPYQPPSQPFFQKEPPAELIPKMVYEPPEGTSPAQSFTGYNSRAASSPTVSNTQPMGLFAGSRNEDSFNNNGNFWETFNKMFEQLKHPNSPPQKLTETFAPQRKQNAYSQSNPQQQQQQQQQQQPPQNLPAQPQMYQPYLSQQPNIAQIQSEVQPQFPSAVETKLQQAELSLYPSYTAALQQAQSAPKQMESYQVPLFPPQPPALPAPPPQPAPVPQPAPPLSPSPAPQQPQRYRAAKYQSPSLWNYMKDPKRFSFPMYYPNPNAATVEYYPKLNLGQPQIKNNFFAPYNGKASAPAPSMFAAYEAYKKKWYEQQRPFIGRYSPPQYRPVKTVDMPLYPSVTGHQFKKQYPQGTTVENPMGFYRPRPIFRHPIENIQEMTQKSYETFMPMNNINLGNPQIHNINFGYSPENRNIRPALNRNIRPAPKKDNKHIKLPAYLKLKSPGYYNMLRQKGLAGYVKKPSEVFSQVRVPGDPAASNVRAYWSQNGPIPLTSVAIRKTDILPSFRRLPVRPSMPHVMPISKTRALEIARIRAARTRKRFRGSYKKQTYNKAMRKKISKFYFPTKKHRKAPSMMTILKVEQPQTDRALIRTKVPVAMSKLSAYYPPNNLNYSEQKKRAETKSQYTRYSFPDNQRNELGNMFSAIHNRYAPTHGRASELAALLSKGNAAKVHQQNLAHFFKKTRSAQALPIISPHAIKKSDSLSPPKKPQKPINLIGFWDKLYKYYSKQGRRKAGISPRPRLTKEESRSNMKELDLVENFLESKFSPNKNVHESSLSSKFNDENKDADPTEHVPTETKPSSLQTTTIMKFSDKIQPDSSLYEKLKSSLHGMSHEPTAPSSANEAEQSPLLRSEPSRPGSVPVAENAPDYSLNTEENHEISLKPSSQSDPEASHVHFNKLTEKIENETNVKRKTDAKIKNEFLLKAMSRDPQPWDKRAKVTFKLSKKSDIPEEPQKVVGVWGSLKRKKKKRKKR